MYNNLTLYIILCLTPYKNLTPFLTLNLKPCITLNLNPFLTLNPSAPFKPNPGATPRAHQPRPLSSSPEEGVIKTITTKYKTKYEQNKHEVISTKYEVRNKEQQNTKHRTQNNRTMNTPTLQTQKKEHKTTEP